MRWLSTASQATAQVRQGHLVLGEGIDVVSVGAVPPVLGGHNAELTGYPYDPDKALEILEEHCIKKAGTWYTKDGPSPEYLELYTDVALPVEDALDDEPGINVPLGPWQLMDVYGWTDVNAMDVFAADMIGSLLGISIETYFPDFGTYTAKMDTMDFDFVHYVMHWGPNGDLFQRYDQMFRGDYVGAWGHYGGYRNLQLNDLLDQLDTEPAGSPEQQNIANQIQEIIGQELPMIPLAGHPNWYIYSNQYWRGWPNEANPFLACGPYGGSSVTTNLHQIVLMLEPAVGPCPTITVTTPVVTTTIVSVVPELVSSFMIATVAVLGFATLWMFNKRKPQ